MTSEENLNAEYVQSWRQFAQSTAKMNQLNKELADCWLDGNLSGERSGSPTKENFLSAFALMDALADEFDRVASHATVLAQIQRKAVVELREEMKQNFKDH
jgi:uncharacterized protein (DUF2267 family)